MKISSRNDFSRMNKYKWIIGRTIHLCGNQFLAEFDRIP